MLLSFKNPDYLKKFEKWLKWYTKQELKDFTKEEIEELEDVFLDKWFE